jgi:hypothetical protein
MKEPEGIGKLILRGVSSSPMMGSYRGEFSRKVNSTFKVINAPGQQ